MGRFYRRGHWIVLALFALLMSIAASAEPATIQFGTVKAGRYGDHGRVVILVPGLSSGPWVWKDTIAQLAKQHVVYAITLAGFDGMPAPKDGDHLFDRADASLLALIEQQKLDRPVLVGHSLGGTLALRFASEHPGLLAGVVAVDGLPIFPGMERLGSAQRQAMAAALRTQMSSATPAQFQAQQLAYMQKIGVIDPALAARYAPYSARSDTATVAAYMAEDLSLDLRPGLRGAKLPMLEISPYNPPDFVSGPMALSERQKTDYYRNLLANAPQVQVLSISPARHFVMLDQPRQFQQALNVFLNSLDRSRP